VFQYLGRPAPVSIVILYCFCYYCMTLCAKFKKTLNLTNSCFSFVINIVDDFVGLKTI